MCPVCKGARGEKWAKKTRLNITVNTSILSNIRDWASSNNTSITDAFERAASEFLEREKHKQDDIVKIFESAPEDDEPFTEEERAEEEEGWREYLAEKSRTRNEVREELASGE
jgi:hypothetical protein